MKVAGIFPSEVKQDLELDLYAEQPLGIAYVMEHARREGHDVALFYGTPPLEQVTDSNAVALSLLTKDVPRGLDIGKDVKKMNPKIKTIVGGPHISGDPNLILEDSIDYGVIGEGEETFVELLERLERGLELSNVKGILYAKNGHIISTGRRERIQSLDGLRPIRDATFDEITDYSFGYPAPSERRMIPIISSRGCTMDCEFCTSKLVWGGLVIYRNPSDVLSEMEELAEDKEKDLFFFDEENLFSNLRKAKQLFRALGSKGYNLGSCADIRLIDKEIADLMKKSGYTQVYWGIESLHPYTLNRDKVGSNKSKIMNVLKLSEERGIANIGMIMIGFDYETEDDISRYRQELTNYPIHQLRVSIATPFPGTDFRKRLKQQGHSFDPDLSKWDTGHLVYDHPTISPERMEELQYEIVRNFYQSKKWDKRISSIAKNFPRLRQSADEFRDYISSNL